MIHKFIDDLSKRIEFEWSKVSFDGASFSAIAKSGLESFDWSYKEQEFQDFFIDKASKVKQLDPSGRFGEPMVTLFNNGKFSIDIIFWLNISPDIHSHAFRGAFKVIDGASLHITYDYLCNEELSPSLMSGEFTSIRYEIINKGQVREILPGDEFIHRVIHLGKPSITLRVRSLTDYDFNQYLYYRNGTRRSFLVGAQDAVVSLLKRIAYIEFLYNMDKQQVPMLARKLIAPLSNDEIIGVIDGLANNLIGKEYEFRNALIFAVQDAMKGIPWFAQYVKSMVNEMKNGPLPYNEFSGRDRLIVFLMELEVHVDVIRQMVNEFCGEKLTKKMLQNLLRNMMKLPGFLQKTFDEVEKDFELFLNAREYKENFMNDGRISLIMGYIGVIDD